jgi:hypothetical protein
MIDNMMDSEFNVKYIFSVKFNAGENEGKLRNPK